MRKVISIIMFTLICIFVIGCNNKETHSDIQQTENGNGNRNSLIDANVIDVSTNYEPAEKIVQADYRDNAVIQIGDTVLKLKEATVRDFILAGTHFEDTDISSADILGWTMNANQMEIKVYVGEIFEITLNRSDYGEEKAIGDCIVGEAEVRFKDVDVLSTDINSLPECNSIFVNGGVCFGDSDDDIVAKLGKPDSDFTADYDYTEITELNYDKELEHTISCQIKDGRIFCIILKN